MAETTAHQELKRLACRWLREQGYLAVAPEVMDATGRFRVDVAGWSDRPRTSPNVDHVRTAIVECKQSRGDYLRDGVRADGLLARRAAVVEALRDQGVQPTSLFRSSGPAEPTLFDAVPVSPDRPGREVRTLRLELTAIERRLFRGVKFSRLGRWRSAHTLWIATPPDLIQPAELPLGWGLIEVSRTILEDGLPASVMASNVIRIRVPASPRQPSPTVPLRLLRNIAVANSRFATGAAWPAADPGSSRRPDRSGRPGPPVGRGGG